MPRPSAVAALILALTAAAVVPAHAAPPAAPAVDSGHPVVLPGSRFYDFTSKITGRAYRIFVFTPDGPAPRGGFPVLYGLDGNSSFSPAVEVARTQAFFREIRPAVLVGIGYPIDDPLLILKTRNRDLTTPISPESYARMPPSPGLTVEDSGGVDDFLKVIEQEVKPLVARLAPVDIADQTLMGHSLGGLTVIRALFTEPSAFRTFIASSPSLFWDGKAVLAGEAPFEAAVAAGRVQPRVMIDAGALEQSPRGYRTGGAVLSQAQVDAIIDTTRMVENASALGARLAAVRGGPAYVVRTVVFPDESHLSVIPAAMSRGLHFALAVDGDGPPARAK